MILKENTYLDIKTSSCLKGVLAGMVLLCHLHGRVDLFASNILGTLFSAFGYLAVSVFFFLSGYGLREASLTKENYIHRFPIKKLLPFFCICSFTILIYFIRDICVGNNIYVLDIVQSFLFGNTIVDNGWYLQSQLLFYVLFYLVYKFVKTHQSMVLTLFLILYCILCATLKLSTTWYEAGLCFPLGVLYSEFKDKISAFFFKNKIKAFAIIIGLGVLFVICLFFGNKRFFAEPIRILIKIISSLLFSLFSIMIVSLINIKNEVTSFLGKISLEIYLLQGIFLNLFRKQFVISNDWLYILIVIICTILLSMLLHPIYSYIAKLNIKKHIR